MAEVKIQIERTDLIEMGVESPVTYTPLRFTEAQFIGYWVSSEGETLTFYIGAQTFMCKNCQKNVELFESIIAKYAAKANIK